MEKIKISRYLFSLGLVALLLGAPLYAQQVRGYYGAILDDRGEEVSYAIVSVMNTEGRIIFNSVCNERGQFYLPQDFLKGRYTFKVSCVGYETGSYEVHIGEVAELGEFTIAMGEQLEEAVITASKPVISAEVDRLIYNVEEDPDAAKMNSAQILEKMPFIKIDKSTQELEVLGEKNFSILINGKRSLLLSEANQYVARALAASNLKQIELITTPDGAYISKDAVINIVTKSALPEGFVGNARVMYDSNTEIVPRLSFTSKVGKLIYNLNYSYEYSNRLSTTTSELTRDFENNEYIEGEQILKPLSSNAHDIALNASYEISKNTLLTLSGGGMMADNNNSSHNLRRYYELLGAEKGRKLGEISSGNRYWGDNNIYKGSVNLQQTFSKVPGRMLTVTYSIDDVSNRARYSYTSGSGSMNYYGNREQLGAIDYYSPIDKNQSYYITTKYTHRDYDSYNKETRAAGVANNADNMEYTQQVFSLSGNYSYRGAKLMVSANASLEHTINDILYGTRGQDLRRNNTTLLAEVRTTYRPNSRNWMMLNLTRRAFRPDVSYLNPYRDYSVPGIITVGNPNLSNQIDHMAVLMYRYFATDKLTIMSIFGYLYSTDMVGNYRYIEGDDIVSTYDNVSTYQRVWVTPRITYTPFNWLDIELSFIYGNRRFNNGGELTSHQEYHAQVRLTADLWKGANFDYSGAWQDPDFAGSFNSQLKKQHLSYFDYYSLSQKFGSKLTLSITIWAPWSKYRDLKREIESPDLYYFTHKQTIGRSIRASLSYDFGNFKGYVKRAGRQTRNIDRSRM